MFNVVTLCRCTLVSGTLVRVGHRNASGVCVWSIRQYALSKNKEVLSKLVRQQKARKSVRYVVSKKNEDQGLLRRFELRYV